MTGPATRLRHRLAVAVGGVGATKVLGALGGILVARLLGPEGKGEQAALILLGMVLGQLGGMGVEFWVQREVARSNLSGAAISRTIRNQVLLGSTVIVVGGAVAGVLGAPWPATGAVVAYSVAWVVSMSWLAVPVGQHRAVRVNLAGVLGALAYLLAVGVLIATDQPDVAAVVAAAALGSVVIAVVAGSPARRLAEGPARVDDRSMLRDAVAFGWPNAAGELLTLAIARLDVVLVIALDSTASAGLYAVASSYAELLWVLPAAASQVLLPQVAWKGAVESTQAMGRVAIVTMVPLGVVAAALAPFVVPLLFGSDYSDAVSAVPLLCAAAVVLGLWRIVVSDLLGRGRARVRLGSAGLGLVVMILADLLLVPAFGIVGASAGSLLGYLAALLVSGRVWSRATGRPWRGLVIGPLPSLQRTGGEDA